MATWAGTRFAEREAYYRSELIKKAMESASEGSALEFLRETDREKERLKARRARSGTRLGGSITIAAGTGLMIFLRAIEEPQQPVHLVSLIPIFVGVVLLGYSIFGSRD